MLFLLFAIGMSLVAFVHLIIPVCFAASRKPYRKKTMLLIALIGGFVGFVVCAIMQSEFRGLAGIYQSTLFTVIGYLMLRVKCSNTTEIQKKEQKPQSAAIQDLSSRRAEKQYTDDGVRINLSLPDEKPQTNRHLQFERASDLLYDDERKG